MTKRSPSTFETSSGRRKFSVRIVFDFNERSFSFHSPGLKDRSFEWKDRAELLKFAMDLLRDKCAVLKVRRDIRSFRLAVAHFRIGIGKVLNRNRFAPHGFSFFLFTVPDLSGRFSCTSSIAHPSHRRAFVPHYFQSTTFLSGRKRVAQSREFPTFSRRPASQSCRNTRCLDCHLRSPVDYCTLSSAKTRFLPLDDTVDTEANYPSALSKTEV